MNTNVLTETDPWANMLQKGMILWRNCSIIASAGHDVEVNNVVFDPTDRGSYLARICLCQATGMWEPEVLSNKADDVHYNRGIAVFVQDVPPAHWTHLVITGVSKRFTQPGRPEQGGCVFARVAMPLEMDDYAKFRARMFDAMRAELNATIDRAAEISNDVWPSGSKPGDVRLVVQPAWTEGAYYNYARITSWDAEKDKRAAALS